MNVEFLLFPLKGFRVPLSLFSLSSQVTANLNSRTLSALGLAVLAAASAAPGTAQPVPQTQAAQAQAPASSAAPSATDLALLQAVRVRDRDAVLRQLAAGANLETRDEAGRTPLYLAVATGQTDVVTLLLDKGADLNGKTASSTSTDGFSRDQGLTPLDKAYFSENVGLLLLLLQRGADTTHRLNNDYAMRRASEAMLSAGAIGLWFRLCCNMART